MRRQKRKPACGRHKPRSWKGSDWVKSKFEKNNVTQNVSLFARRRLWTRVSRLVVRSENPAQRLDPFALRHSRDPSWIVGGIETVRLGCHRTDHCDGLHSGIH